MSQKQPNFVSSRNYLDLAERFLDIGFWNADLTTGEVRGTDGFFRLLRLPPGEAFNLQKWTTLLHAEDREDFRSICPLAAMGVSISRDVRLVDLQRPPRWIRISVEEPASPNQVVGLIQDGGVEREAKAALYRERARLNAFIEMMGGAFWARDLNGVVGDLRGWEQLTGRDQAQSDEEWLEAIHPDDRGKVEAVREACNRDGLAREVSYRLLHADGRYREVLARTAPVRRENGTPIEWIGVVTEGGHRKGLSRQNGAMLRPQQLRAARAFLGWSAEQLAVEAGVSTATIRRYETTGEHMKDAPISAIVAALTRCGLELTGSSTEMGLTLQLSNTP